MCAGEAFVSLFGLISLKSGASLRVRATLHKVCFVVNGETCPGGHWAPDGGGSPLVLKT
jgi:hypothetical protein